MSQWTENIFFNIVIGVSSLKSVQIWVFKDPVDCTSYYLHGHTCILFLRYLDPFIWDHCHFVVFRVRHVKASSILSHWQTEEEGETTCSNALRYSWHFQWHRISSNHKLHSALPHIYLFHICWFIWLMTPFWDKCYWNTSGHQIRKMRLK